jgi:hypothetical protein
MHKSCHAHTINVKPRNKIETSCCIYKEYNEQINTIAMQYAHSILVHKWRLENRQFVSYLQHPPLTNITKIKYKHIGLAQTAVLSQLTLVDTTYLACTHIVTSNHSTSTSTQMSSIGIELEPYLWN